MEKLRDLMKKYTHLVQRYHVQYLAQFDALVLNDTIQVFVENNKHLFVSLKLCLSWTEVHKVSGRPPTFFKKIPNLETLFPLLQSIYVCPEEESVLMSSFVSTLSALSVKQGNHNTILHLAVCKMLNYYILMMVIGQTAKVKQPKTYENLSLNIDLESDLMCLVWILSAVEDKEEFDFRGLRLDWLRLQVGGVTTIYVSF